jgi:hypothetical protein
VNFFVSKRFFTMISWRNEMRKSLFPDDRQILVIAETKQAQADALPYGSDKRNLQKEANSYKILSEAAAWISGELKPP